MNKIPLQVGRVARSQAGRDSGRLFVVIEELDSEFVLIADGDLRKIDRPKKKRRRHLHALAQLEPSLQQGATLQDHQIRKLLKGLTPQEEG